MQEQDLSVREGLKTSTLEVSRRGRREIQIKREARHLVR